MNKTTCNLRLNIKSSITMEKANRLRIWLAGKFYKIGNLLVPSSIDVQVNISEDEALAQFNELLGLAQLGDVDALNALPGLAQTLLGFGQQDE